MHETELSYTEIKAQLESAEAQAESLRARLNAQIQAEKAGVIAGLKDKIAEYGIVQSDLFAAKKTLAKKEQTAGEPRARYADKPTGEIYRGGKIPGWLSERLAATGLKYPEYRDQFMARIN